MQFDSKAPDIRGNVAKIQERVLAASSRAGRDPGSIKLVAVSKGRSVQEIKQALEAGIKDIGENRVQEALRKCRELLDPSSQPTAHWHMVGHLQGNKVKESVKIFDLIQSIDSLELIGEIDKQASRINKVQDILLEVNISQEESKFGLRATEAPEIVSLISGFKNIHLKGFMTIAPMVSDQEDARLYFRRLRELRDKIDSLKILPYELLDLSMGMTDDFEVAIEEGATMIRLGRAIFEG